MFADVVCPFAYVGLTRLISERDRRGAPVRVRIRSWPLEIVNGQPMDPGHIAAEVADIRAQVAPDLFAGFDAAAFPASSLPALALAQAAEAADPATGEAVSMELRRALFEEGQDIGQDSVLDRIADRHGLRRPDDFAAVLADHADGVARGVVGSPHVFAGDYTAFCPVLDISRAEDGHFVVAVDQEKYDEMLRMALGE